MACCWHLPKYIHINPAKIRRQGLNALVKSALDILLSIRPIKRSHGYAQPRTFGKILGIFVIVLMMVVIPAPFAKTAPHSTLTVAQTTTPLSGTADYSLTANPSSLTMTPGSTQTVQITATSLNGFAGSVYMTAFSYPAAVSLNPTTLMLSPGGSQSSTLTLAVPTSASPGNYTADVEAIGGCTLFHDVFVSFSVKAPDFSITPSKSQLTVSTTVSDSTALNLKSLDSFSGTVSIFTFSSDFSVTPSSATVSLSPGGTGSTGTITVIANSGTTPGNYTLSFDASSGSLFHFADISVTVTGSNFGISANPEFLTIVAGGSTNSSTITVTPVSGFTGTVALTASPSSPTGLTGGLSIGTVSLPPAETSTLTVSAPGGTPPGVYDITVTGTSGSLSNSVDVIIRVKGPDFDMSSNPFFVAVVEGGASCTSTVTASSIDGFSGSITLKQKNDGGLTVTNTTTALNLPAIPSSTLTISAPIGSIPGFYSINVNGTSGSLLHHAYVDVLVIGPDFGLTANPSTLTVTAGGGSATSTISLVIIDTFSNTVSLTTSSFESGVTATVSPTTISTGTSALTVSAASGTTPGDYYTIEVTGTSGKLVHTIYISVTVVGPDFTLSASPTTVAFNAGSLATSTITLNPLTGFSDSVDLFVSSSANLNASITPTQIAHGSYSATLNLNSTIPGSYTVDVSADNVTDGLYHDVSIPVTVNGPDFTLTASPSTLNIAAGSSFTSTIGVTAIHGFSNTVSLSSTQSIGITTGFSPGGITPSQTSTLTITVDASVAAGSYTIDVQGTSGSLTHDVSISVYVSGFTVSASPTTLTLDQGTSQTPVITVSEVNGFTGTVLLTKQASPGLTTTLTPSSITGSGTSMLTIAASSNITPGTYLVNVTGTSGSLSQEVTITVTVPAPDFTIAPSTATTTQCTVGTGCPTTITIAALNGFSGTVAFTVKAQPTGITCAAPHSVVGSGSTTLTCTAIAMGSYDVVVNGTSGSLHHATGTITYQVAAAPDFSLTAGTVSPAGILVGSSGTSSITVSPVGGFAGPVSFSVSASTPSGLTCQTPLTWSGSGAPTLSCSSNLAGNYTVMVTGSGTIGSSTVTRSTNSILFHVVDFAISSSPSSETVDTNVAGTSTITITALNSFAGIVGITTDNSACTLSPSSVTGMGTLALSCTFTTAGSVTVTITGSISGLSHKTIVAFTVNQGPDFSIAALPTTLDLNTGASGASSISVNPLQGFTGTIIMTETVSPTTGLTATFNTTSLSHGTSGYGTAKLTLNGAADGSYTVTVTGTSGSLTHAVTLQVTVTTPDFTVSASPTTVSFVTGNSGTSTVTIAPLNGFSSTVSLASSVSPSTGLTVTFSTSTIASGSGTSTATFTGTTGGSFTVTITGTSGSASHTATVQVTVNVPNFTVSSSPTTVTIQAGNNGTSMITVAPTNGFSGTVTLSATLSPSGPTVSLNTASITGGSGTSTLTIKVGNGVAAGTYTVTIQGTSGSLSHSATVTVTVTSVQSGAAASTILGLAPTVFYIIIGVLAVVLLAGLAFVIRGRTPRK